VRLRFLSATIHGGLYTACTAGVGGRGAESRLLPGAGRRRKKKKSSSTGRAWTDMYEAARQVGGGGVQGQARQRRQTPVLEEQRGEMRYAPADGMDVGLAAERIRYRQRVW
jgi:hypothetical protein